MAMGTGVNYFYIILTSKLIDIISDPMYRFAQRPGTKLLQYYLKPKVLQRGMALFDCTMM